MRVFLKGLVNYYHYYGEEPVSKQPKKSLTLLSAAVGLALTLGAPAAMAGVVNNTNNAPTVLGACGADGADSVACVGAWNLGNVQVDLIHLVDGSTFGTFDPTTGSYTQMVVGDSFVSKVYSDATNKTTLTAKVGGKVWPVGEPTAIKAVNGDTLVNNGKPKNCLINTSYLETTYLDTAAPSPVICSSPFQSHKRFKIAMQPATTLGVASGDGQQPIDLVFNTTDNGSITPYQVFSKINNYTDKRLSGYKIEVGVGTGTNFKTATDLGISNQLYLSLGIGEDATSTPVGADLFTGIDGLATFSHGLFGAIDLPHFPDSGFFSNTTAYYPVSQTCTTAGVDAACLNSVTVASGASIPASDTIYSSGTLSTNYTHLFGSWLPSIWEPKGIFFDADNNPTTDPKLVAWWNGTEWLMPSKDTNGNPVYDADGYAVFVPVTSAELTSWNVNGAGSLYAEDVIEDVLNLGINYIVHVGDFNGGSGATGTFTVRIIPVVAADQTKPVWVVDPAPTLPTTTSSSGGGCTVGGDGRFDPIFPALLLAGLGFLGLRRFSRKL